MDRNIKIAYALSFCKNSWFWLGTWIFFYLKFTNYAGIGVVETALIVSMTISEIPTGAIGDLLGKKKTLITSFVLQAFGIGIGGFAQNVYWLIVGVFIAGVGASFYSGIFEALVYDSLKQKGQQLQYEKVISNISTIGLIAPAICGVLGGFLYVYNFRLPFLLNAFFYTVGAIVCFLLIEPKIDSEKFSLSSFFRQTQVGLKELFKTKAVINQTIILISIGLVVVICDEMLNGFLGVEFKFSPQALGILWSAFYVVSAFVSQLTPFLKRRFADNTTLLLIGFSIAFSLLFSPWLGIILGGVSLFVRYSLQTLFYNYSTIVINDNTESKNRATTLSTFNLLKNIPYVLSAYFLGSLADYYSAKSLAALLGVSLLILLVVQSIRMMSEKRKFGK